MIAKRAGRAVKVSLTAVGMMSALALAGCAEENGSGIASSGGGEGIDAGASLEDYQAAFADIDPIELNTQTPAPQGSATGLPMEKYFEAVTEWSDGKITWNVQYANAVAGPTENDDALLDGRLDFASILPLYEPADWPANNALIFGGFISDQSAIEGAMSSNAWPNQVAFENEEIMAEFEDKGLVALLPIYNSGANAFFCAEERTSLDAIKGAAIGAGGVAQSAQVEALGGSASSVVFTELFESLQRGVVDCTVSSPTVSVLGGFTAEAPNVVIDPDAGFALAPGTLAMSQTAWDGLPLVAQQLLWDRMDVFVESNIVDKVFVNNAEMAAVVKEAGGDVTPFDDDARATLQDTNEQLIEDLRGTDQVSDGDALVDAMLAANDSWQETVAGLGYEPVDYIDFDTYMETADVDLAEYASTVISEIFDAHRPS